MLPLLRTTSFATLGLLSALPFVTPRPALADAIVGYSGHAATEDCSGGAAVVNGDSDHIVFRGGCRSLQVNGAGNVVHIDLVPGANVTISGDGNRIQYLPVQPEPVVTAQGSSNTVSIGSADLAGMDLPSVTVSQPAPMVMATPMPASPPATLVLDGDLQNRDISCAGQNVVIRGSNGRFVLRGGCNALTVEGRGDAIQAELMPGAHVDVGSQGVMLNYTLTGDGPPPVVNVAPGSQAAQVTQTVHTQGPTIVTTQ